MRTDRLSVKILALLLSLLTLLPLASCGVTAPDETEEITAAPTTTEEATTAVSTAEAEEPAKYTVVLNAPASTAIHTPVQASFLSDDDPLSVKDYLRPAYTAQSVNYDDKPGTLELGRTVPITLTWSVETEQTESDIRVFSIRVWPKSAPSKAVTKILTKSVTSFTLENPMIGENYCWTVTATDGEGNSYASDVGTFTTDAQGPRNLTVGGLTNVRDLGGWNTEDGGRVRQGLLFRASRADGRAGPACAAPVAVGGRGAVRCILRAGGGIRGRTPRSCARAAALYNGGGAEHRADRRTARSAAL